MQKIEMVDLAAQYRRLKPEIDRAVWETLESSAFINGPAVRRFTENLERYLGVRHVIPCGNGTDALQIAFMALDLQPGDEVIVPSFTYVATAEVIGLLKLTPVLVDVDPASFNVTVANIEKAITARTRAIVPVHLFGQSCDMAPILQLARRYEIYVVEDNAQALGAEYIFRDGSRKHTGTAGHIGCTSFFPSKTLGGYGDGGALMTDDDALAERARMIANHGQAKKYHHRMIGCNSRLDSLQAAVLDVKLKHLDEFAESRRAAARRYNEALEGVEGLTTPAEMPFSTHVYHQYTLQVADGRRDALQAFLQGKGVPSTVYYPVPLQEQEAFKFIARIGELPSTAKALSGSVLSLPIHTEMKPGVQDYILEQVLAFFR